MCLWCNVLDCVRRNMESCFCCQVGTWAWPKVRLVSGLMSKLVSGVRWRLVSVVRLRLGSGVRWEDVCLM